MNTSFESLVASLLKQKENECTEFKQNFADQKKIGETISAISNAAALLEKPFGYIVWGIADSDHEIIGTTFAPKKIKIGNEELENWLLQHLNPRIHFIPLEGNIQDKNLVVFKISAAINCPVSFSNIEYIRVGSYNKKLHDYPEKERELWRIFDREQFEGGIAKTVNSDLALSLIDYPKYFVLLNQALPDNRKSILQRLVSEKIIQQTSTDDNYYITNLGAILFAKELSSFERLNRKALRIIIYSGENRIKTIREHIVNKGYAVGFEDALEYVNSQLPQNEEIEQALRKEIHMYPPIAIRELVANALIHQDFNISGAGPTVEIFSDRMEITNPGKPLIDPLRFIDEPPRSRNEAIASMMRRLNICEERGSGIDKVINAIELFQLPAPNFRESENSTITFLYSPKAFSQMNKEEKIRACYQHACLQYVSNKQMTNASLRKRLNISEKNYPIASRIIRDAIEANLIKSKGENVKSRREVRYVPFWA